MACMVHGDQFGGVDFSRKPLHVVRLNFTYLKATVAPGTISYYSDSFKRIMQLHSL